MAVGNHVTIARSPSRRTLAIVAIVLAAIAAFIYYRWRTSGFEWSLFLATFKGVHWGWLGLSAAAVVMITYYGRALRWQVMVRPLRPESSTWRIFLCTVIGFTAIVFFGRAGELVRPYLISVKERVPFSSQMASWLLERVLDLLMVLVIFGVALAQIQRTGLTPGPHLKLVLQAGGTVLMLAGGGCLILLLAFRSFGEPMNQRILSAITFLPQRYQDRIAKTPIGVHRRIRIDAREGFMSLLFGYSMVEWLLLVGCFICIFKAFPATEQFSLTDILIFMGFVSLGSAIQIPGVGGGMQVAAVVVLTELFGMSLEVASGMAVALWIVTFVVVVPFGVVLAFREGINWSNLKHVAEEKQ